MPTSPLPILRPVALAAVLVAGLAQAALAAPPTYHANDLGSLGGGVTRPTAINDLGMITGQSTSHTNDNRGIAFLLWKNKMKGLAQDTPGHPTRGNGVNASGLVVGTESSNFRDNYRTWPFLWPMGGAKLRFADVGDAKAVNDDGVVTGSSAFAGAPGQHAYAWRAGVMTDLGTVGGLLHSGGNALNARGDIAGWVGDETVLPYTHAMVRIDGVMTDLGTFGSTGAMANGINATGAVCGTTEEDDLKTRRGFVWQAGAVQMLAGPAGTGSIEARAINDDGVVVGQMHVPGNVEGRTVVHAFVAKDGVAVDLNTLLLPEDAATWVLEDATSVNNHGRIVGTGRVRATGETHAFGLTPVR